eukprot:g2870.t1
MPWRRKRKKPPKGAHIKKKVKGCVDDENDVHKILTPYGRGIVVRKDEGKLVCALNAWKLADGNKVQVYIPYRKPKYPKKRVVLVIAYLGTGYYGLQAQDTLPTIEGEIETALYKAGFISIVNYGGGTNLQKIGWGRTARTDKGVHAVGNILSMKLIMQGDVSTFAERINAYLPETIRVIDCIRAAKNFNPKNACNGRTYDYLLPLSALRKCSQEYRWSRQDAWETGGRFEVGRREIAYRRSAAAAAIQKPKSLIRNSESIQHDVEDDMQENEIRSSIARMRCALRLFVGTRPYHNFARRVPQGDPRSWRHIRSFTCSDPFEIGGVRFVKLTVSGDSFVLNQIRKMVGAALQYARYALPLEFIKAGLSTSIRLPCSPMAPADGLLLAGCNFRVYNERHADDFGSLDTSSGPIAAKLEAFKRNFVGPPLAKRCETINPETNPFESWLMRWDMHVFENDLARTFRSIIGGYVYWSKYLIAPKRETKKRRDRGSTKKTKMKKKRRR